MGIVEQYFLQLNTLKRRFRRSIALLTVLSVLVMLTVFWNLRQTGIALANDACCGLKEHQHSMDCPMEKVLICGFDSEEPTEITTEATTEATTEPSIETYMDVPEEEPSEESTEVSTETSTESVIEGVMDAAADVLSGLIPTVHAADIPEEEAHIHTDACYETAWLCGLEEHIHDFSCYSDVNADLEDWDTWFASIPELTGQISEDIVLVAQSQLGCRESGVNFALADDGETRNGITRYGQWYGNPYGAWSNMFTSFCLRFAGLSDVPINSGAEKMQMDWQKQNLYRYAGSYEPVAGDIVFLDKNLNGTAESTAVVVQYFDFVLTVIEGDVDDSVVRQEYPLDDPSIIGYGMTNAAGRVAVFAAGDSSAAETVGQTAAYGNGVPGDGGTFILYTPGTGGKYYAIDGNGRAVEIQINGTAITADVADPNTLYWKFEKANNYDGKSAYYICNAATGRYLHPNKDAGTEGSLHTGKWETAFYTSGNGVRLRGARQDAYALLSGSEFTYTGTQNGGSIFYFGKTPSELTLWLDGTNGNIMSCRGSDNTKYTVYSGVEAQLPSTWKSPVKYSYSLAGWVNIKNGDYYLPGETIVITEDTVLYADWVASSYDIGRYNAYVTDTVSTRDFITTYMFDYSSLINLLSTQVDVTVSGSGHSETWSHVENGTVSYKGQTTLDFSFNDHDTAGTITNLNGLNSPNKYTNGTGVYSGIYTEELGKVLFGTDNLFDPETGTGIVGKHYLGQADHLFQINTDPTSEYYGYYYYDAKLNAASYNQSEQRFYVYDYLARSSDSANNDIGKYSDFLPLNSPYANFNGNSIKTYNYAGVSGEYNGVTHYSYDARYDTDGSVATQVMANMWFGMRTDIRFGLPDAPGQKLENGAYGNRDIYGNEMHFRFTGDDDVWILLDGKVVLDLGGIHQEAEGDINFSTGEVKVNGVSQGTLSGITAGEYTLSILYLERGASMSNCGIYFNLAPRFSLSLQKEDVLTQKLLDGAKFRFYYDQACTKACELWPTKQDYKPGTGTNEFVIEDGKLTVWGLSPSRTYYIKELSPPAPENKDDPDALRYESAIGVIKLTLDKNGVNAYGAAILEGPEGEISNGFTVYDFRIDEENQAAYLTITNAQNWITETTSVHVEKKWGDTKDHTYDAVTVYLNVTDAKGTRRIRQITLSKENNWKYAWTNLPMYPRDPVTNTENKTQPLVYTVSEAYVPGYTYTIEDMKTGTVTGDSWDEATSFANGKVYLLKTDHGYLSAQPGNGGTLYFITDEAAAKESPLALWTATTSDGRVKLTNQNGQSLGFQRNNGWFFSVGNSGEMNLTAIPLSNGLGLAVSTYQNQWYTENVFICGLNDRGYLGADNSTNPASALVFHPMVKGSSAGGVVIDGIGYTITNVPLETETSLKVTKKWEYPTGDEALFEKAQITFKLLANEVDTGRTEAVSLKSNWTATFEGLPYYDKDGKPIAYTVVESWETKDWIPIYGEVKAGNGNIPTYETIVTNRYRWIDAFELPSTGGIGHPIFVLSGLILISAPLVYGLSLRRRYRKGARR